MKKNKQKKDRTGLYIILGIVFIISFSIFISSYYNINVDFNDVSYSEYKEIYNSDDVEFVYVGRSDCTYCKQILPHLDEVQKELSIKFNYLNTDTMTESNFNDIVTTSTVFEGEWGTPTLLAVKDGKVLGYLDGYRDKIVIKSFVESSLKGEEYEEPSYEDEFDSLSYSEYEKLFEANDLTFVYVGRSDCSFCQQTVPTLVELQEDLGIKFKYLNTDTMTEEDFTDIEKTGEAFEGEWGTPTMIAIKEGKVLNFVSGAQGEKVIRNFIEKSLDGVEI